MKPEVFWVPNTSATASAKINLKNLPTLLHVVLKPHCFERQRPW